MFTDLLPALPSRLAFLPVRPVQITAAELESFNLDVEGHIVKMRFCSPSVIFPSQTLR